MNREQIIERMRAGPRWDVLVIGGGATGLGCAVDAAARGYQTLLLEAGDVAAGTSSRSTKLIHGGVRYLAQGNVMLVHQSLRERGLLLANAPHLVRPQGFLVPTYSRRRRLYYLAGLKLYGMLAGRLGIERVRSVRPTAACEMVPRLRASGLRGGIVYHDAQFDDARLAVSLLATLERLGGCAINYCGAESLLRHNGQICGAVARDAETGQVFEVHARVVINAAGPFGDIVRRMEDPSAAPLLRPSRGSHLVLDAEALGGRWAMMVPRTDDGRVLFAIPWMGKVVVGTTDVPAERVELEVQPSPAETADLLGQLSKYLDSPPQVSHVRSVFAGLRPLIAHDCAGTTASLARDHKVLAGPGGLISVMGGKWTTYRLMAADAVDRAAALADLPARPCPTANLRLADSEAAAGPEFLDDSLARPIHPALPYTHAHVVRAARREMARTLTDVLARRTRSLVLDARAACGAARDVAATLARALGRDETWQRDQVAEFLDLARGYLPPSGT